MQEECRSAGFLLWHCENFATIAKISQSLRNFAMHSFFARIAKFRYNSENSLS